MSKRIPAPDTYAASFWLQDAWKRAEGRDPVDVVNDAAWLLELAQQRLADVQVGQ